jgi:hypothetical protein
VGTGAHYAAIVNATHQRMLLAIGRRRLPRRRLEMGVALRRKARIEKKPYVWFAANRIQFRASEISHIQCLFAVRLQCAAKNLCGKDG